MKIEAGTRLGEYEILEPIGPGGRGLCGLPGVSAHPLVPVFHEENIKNDLMIVWR
jgi:hypothetical protein